MSFIAHVQRLLAHAWREALAPEYPLPHDTLVRLGEHVAQCERTHSGEIRIYVETALPWADLKHNAATHILSRQRAIALFSSQRVWDTVQNNGVLIYLLLTERSIEIIADRGISQRVDKAVWDAMLSQLSKRCREGALEAGLTETVTEVSALLAQHFPLRAGELNPNELADFPALGRR
jgi:uncharacterized membrane protein